MVSRTTVMTLPVALSLVLAGCSAPAAEPAASTSAEPTSTTSAPATPGATDAGTPTDGATSSAEATANSDGAQPSGAPTVSTDVSVLPTFLTVYPKAEVLSASRSKAEAKADSAKLDEVSLVLRAKAKPKDILNYYAKALKKADFETYGKEVHSADAEVVNFKSTKNDGLLVVTVSADPKDKATSIVSIGGTVAP